MDGMYRVITSLAPCDRLQDIQHNMYVHVCRRRQLTIGSPVMVRGGDKILKMCWKIAEFIGFDVLMCKMTYKPNPFSLPRF